MSYKSFKGNFDSENVFSDLLFNVFWFFYKWLFEDSFLAGNVPYKLFSNGEELFEKLLFLIFFIFYLNVYFGSYSFFK
jgi:hypothetical protein